MEASLWRIANFCARIFSEMSRFVSHSHHLVLFLIIPCYSAVGLHENLSEGEIHRYTHSCWSGQTRQTASPRFKP